MNSFIQALEPIRNELAAQMAEFEAQFGPVETAPIRIGCPPPPVFSINIPGKPKPEAKTPRVPGPKKPRANMLAKVEKLAVVRDLLLKGLSFADVAERADFTPKLSVKYVQRMCYEHGLKRGYPSKGGSNA
jgi:hypothetical protein